MSTILARRGIPALPKLSVPLINVVNNSDLPDGLRSHCKFKLRVKAWTLPPLAILTPVCDEPSATGVCTWDLSMGPDAKLIRFMTKEEEDVFFSKIV